MVLYIWHDFLSYNKFSISFGNDTLYPNNYNIFLFYNDTLDITDAKIIALKYIHNGGAIAINVGNI